MDFSVCHIPETYLDATEVSKRGRELKFWLPLVFGQI
jgi:hypothetical protein